MALNDPVYTQTERDEWPHLIGIKKNLYSLASFTGASTGNWALSGVTAFHKTGPRNVSRT